jgi:hypothetical protein
MQLSHGKPKPQCCVSIAPQSSQIMLLTLCHPCTSCPASYLLPQRWRLAEIRIEDYVFVLLARLIGALEAAVSGFPGPENST